MDFKFEHMRRGSYCFQITSISEVVLCSFVLSGAVWILAKVFAGYAVQIVGAVYLVVSLNVLIFKDKIMCELGTET